MSAVGMGAVAVALLSAVGVVASRQTIYSALALVMNMVSLAALFLLLNAQFLFAVQIIIYAGAVMVLFVFIIALLSSRGEANLRLDSRGVVGLAGVIVSTVTLFVLANNHTTFDSQSGVLHGQVAGQHSDPYHSLAFTPDAVNANGNVQTVAGQLFTIFLVPFEITSLLLIVAAVGAVYLSRRLPKAAP